MLTRIAAAARSGVLLAGVLCLAAAAAGPANAGKLPDTTLRSSASLRSTSHLRLVCPFEHGLYACEGAANPFTASGRVKLVGAGGARGKVARFEGHDAQPDGRSRRPWEKSAMIVDGVNLPADRGTVGFWIRFSGKRHWTDGKRTWLAVFVPDLPRTRLPNKEEGTGLVLLKEADDTLSLAVYQFYNNRRSLYFSSRKSGHEVAEPDAIPLKLSVRGPKAGDWAHVRFAWDQASGKVWLGLNDTLKSAPAELRKTTPLCLLLGTPPKIFYAEARGFDGDVDDLVIDARTPDQAADAGRALPTALPPMAKAPDCTAPAVHLKGSPLGEKQESLVRAHLNNALEVQRNSGWAFSTAWPSRMCFLSSKVVVPYSRHFFNGCKDGNSAFCALMLLAGYMALDEPAYLQAAEKTADALMRMQYPDGHWPYCARYRPETDTYFALYTREKAPLEDHVQSHPTTLLWLLHDLTRKPEYKAAADRGLAFIMKAQNPNGSWSHHYNTKLKCGQATRGQYLRAGEINDDSTADQMMIALIAYRRTGDIKYLAAYLRGADWLVSAFIDEKAKGWAQQYDEHNKPIEARHFEPPAISLSEGIHSAPLMLMRTCRMTRDRRYLEPVLKWKKWMWDNRIFLNKERTRWGWHMYYDPADGKPFRMAKRKKLPPDPRSVREGGYTWILRKADQGDRPVKPVVPSIKRGQRILRAAEGAGEKVGEPVTNRLRPLPLVKSFDWKAGSWLYGHKSPWGPGFSCATVRVALISWSVFMRRQVRGQIPLNHRMSTLNRRQWASPFYYLVPPAEMEKRLTADQLARARAYTAKLKGSAAKGK